MSLSPLSSKTVTSSKRSMRTLNRIREITDKIDMSQTNKSKTFIPLSIGDPSYFGNLNPGDFVIKAVTKALQEGKANGYAHSCGLVTAREAIAREYGKDGKFPLTSEDVIITSGCSGALDLCFSVLCNEGDNFLIPKPGFSLYDTLCGNQGIEPRYYPLLAEKDWEADLIQMESLVDDNTKGILVNNPSNPCGSVYSKEHLQEILKVAEKHNLPIICDEVYANMTFFGKKFYSLGDLSENVPILSVGGLAKQFLVPGWRLGWILIHDRHLQFKDVRVGLQKLTTLILGANTIIQAAVEDILLKYPQDYFSKLCGTLEENAAFTYERLSRVEGLKIIKPHGAMYCMVGITKFNDIITDDVSFARQLLLEQSVLVLPGSCFNMKNYFRIVICAPKQKLEEAYERIEEFCKLRLK